MLEMKICTALTGLSNDYVAGNGSSMFVPRRALVHTLVMFSLRPADVHHQGPGVGLHGDVGVLIDVKVGPVSSPGETEEQKKQTGVVTEQLVSSDNHANIMTGRTE